MNDARLTWLFSNPNRFASILCIGVLLLAVALLGVLRDGAVRKWGHLRSVSLLLVMSLFVGLLSATGSRAACLSIIVSLMYVAYIDNRTRKQVLILAFLFVVYLAATPTTGARVAQAFSFGGDFSIRNRIILWSGTLEMLADFSNSIVGLANFRDLYTEFYAPLDISAQYRTPVSDYLTVWVALGPIGLGVYLSFVVTAIFPGGPTGRFLDGSIAAKSIVLSIAVNGVFTTIIAEPAIAVANFAWVIVALCLRFCPTSKGRIIRMVFVLGVGFIFALLGLQIVIASYNFGRSHAKRFVSIDGGQCLIVNNPSIPISSSVLCITNGAWGMDAPVPVRRRLVKAYSSAVYVRPSNRSFVLAAAQIVASMDAPMVYYASGYQAQDTLSKWYTELPVAKKIIAINPVLWSPLDMRNPCSNMAPPAGEVVILYEKAQYISPPSFLHYYAPSVRLTTGFL